MNPEELTLEQSISQAMQALPLPARRYFSEGKYTFVAKRLAGKYGLRADQSGIVERELMLLLLGTETADEFAASLKTEAMISDDVRARIMTDLNQEMFVPLQAEMQKEPQNPRIVAAIARAPKMVQDVLSDPRTEQIVVEIGRGKNLHIDQIGVLTTMNRDMLLGLASPQEFLQKILAIGVPDVHAKAILSEVNTRIFMPLHDKMRRGPQVSTPPQSFTPPPTPRPYTPPPAPRPVGVASAPLPPKLVLPGILPGQTTPSINRLEGRTIPPPVYPPPAPRRDSPPTPPPPHSAGPDPYREAVE